MESERADEVLLVKYLLGGLSEEEQAQVEDRAFGDADYLSALESAEADLIDAWVRGELSQADRRAFERRFFTSPERRRKVEFARDFSRILADSKTAERATSDRVSMWQSLMFWRGWQPGFRFAAAMAAGIICVGGAAWMIGQNARMRSEVAALEAQRRTLESQHQQSLSQLAEEKRRAESLAARLDNASSAGNPTLVASLFLMPGLSRSESRLPELVLRPSAQVAHIAIQLEARDDYPRFRVELRTRSGNDVLTLGSVARSRDSVAFDVPASALAAGEYELALKGVAANQSLADVGYYYFRVQKQ